MNSKTQKQTLKQKQKWTGKWGNALAN